MVLCSPSLKLWPLDISVHSKGTDRGVRMKISHTKLVGRHLAGEITVYAAYAYRNGIN